MTYHGRCACGALQVTCDGAPLRVAACHCDDCRRLTGSAFSLNARWPTDRVQVTGDSQEFVRKGDEGSTITNHFCPSCGVSVFYDVEGLEGVAVRVGCLDQRSLFRPDFSVYDNRKPEWS